jgi:filamentous hemagglutinin
MGSGGAGFTVGTRTQKIDNQSVRHSASASTVGSTSGDVLVVAAKDFRQTGSDILAPQGSIDIAAQRVDIKEARNTVESTTRTSFKQTGVSVAVSSPVITAVQTAQQMVTAAAATKDSRMQALAVANVGMAGMAAYDAVQAGQGTTINGKDNQIATGTDADGKPTSRDSTAADKVGGFTVSISLGTSKSSSKTDYASSTAVASHVNAGGGVRMTAAGAGTESDLRLEGSTIKAGHAVTLQADDAITLQAAGNTDAQHSKNKSSNASIGVAISSDGGIGVTASGGLGRGHADGSDLSWRNTHIEASQVAMTSGGDMTLRGAVAKAAQVSATVGGNLQIESLQDTTHFDSRQKSVSGGVMIGTTVTGNATYAQSQIDSDYASVVEQTSIRAGDGGFHVEVAGDATLRGGAITGTHLAVEQGRNSFTTAGTLALTDIENRAQYKATAVSVSVGTGVNPAGKLTPAGSSIGLGNDSDRDASTTQAAISAIAGNRDARTGDKETGIAQIFDAGTVQKDIDAQVQITQIFSAQAPRLVASYADSQKNISTIKPEPKPIPLTCSPEIVRS